MKTNIIFSGSQVVSCRDDWWRILIIRQHISFGATISATIVT
jgi:hypothetical protein